LTRDPIVKAYKNFSFLDRDYLFKDSAYVSTAIVSPFHISVNTILFIVSVPVLSEQMLLAPPIVSQAYMRLTKFWSFNIFLTEKAKERVTERGSPSGMAITMMVIAKIKKFRSLGKSSLVFHGVIVILTIAKRIERTTTINTAPVSANFPISLASVYSFCSRGVLVYSSCRSRALILPMHDSAPTTTITILPYPVNTLVPPIKTGET
jgi:hypothetical protein